MKDSPALNAQDDQTKSQATVSSSENVDTMLAKELNAMTPKERADILEEIHGVKMVASETTEMLAQGLDQLQMELRKINTKPAYDLAVAMDNGLFVSQRKFRLMFLRAASFDPKAAAHRLVEFLEKKLQFFGPEVLVQKVRVDDLDDESKRLVESGKIQQLQWRDRMDRSVIVDLNVPHGPTQPDDAYYQIKAMFYMVMAAAEEEESQRRGLVFVFFFFTRFCDKLEVCVRRAANSAKGLSNWCPLHINCSHVCVHSEAIGANPVVDLLRGIVGRDFRARVRVHMGTFAECCDSLTQYGIPSVSLPINLHGDDIKKDVHNKWILRRKKKDLVDTEAGTRSSVLSPSNTSSPPRRVLGPPGGSCIELPTRKDVLLGRGRIYHQHVGNLLLRYLVQSLLCGDDRKISQSERRRIVDVVCKQMWQWGGRFLQKSQPLGCWTEVEPAVAATRVAACVRTVLSRRNKEEGGVGAGGYFLEETPSPPSSP